MSRMAETRMTGETRRAECGALLVIPSAVEESRARAATSLGMQGVPCHFERSRGISCSGSRVPRNAGRPLSFRAQSRNLVLGQPRPSECRAPLVIPSAVEESRARAATVPRNAGRPLSFRAQSRNLVPGQPRPSECRAPLVIPSAVEESRARAAASLGMQGAPCHSERSRGISCPGSYRPSECRAPLVIPSAVEESRARAAASLGMQGAPCHSERSRGISCSGSRVPPLGSRGVTLQGGQPQLCARRLGVGREISRLRSAPLEMTGRRRRSE